MKSRKYESFESAVEALKQLGELKHAGREKNFAIYGLTLPNRKEHTLFVHYDGLVTLYEPGKPIVIAEPKKVEEPKKPTRKIYENGICDCKAMGKFRWQWIEGEHTYMCVKCNKPVYYGK